MKEGEVLLAAMPQADGAFKYRPAVCLAILPPFQDLLMCGISTQVHQAVADFDEVISPNDPDFAASGLKAASVVRLGYLTALPRTALKGQIGAIDRTRLNRLRTNLSEHLRPSP